MILPRKHQILRRVAATCTNSTATTTSTRLFSDEKEFGGRMPDGVKPETSFATMCLHAGQAPDPSTGSRVTPICMNTGFVFKDSDDAAAKFALAAFGPIYTRIGNPTNDALEGTCLVCVRCFAIITW